MTDEHLKILTPLRVPFIFLTNRKNVGAILTDDRQITGIYINLSVLKQTKLSFSNVPLQIVQIIVALSTEKHV